MPKECKNYYSMDIYRNYPQFIHFWMEIKNIQCFQIVCNCLFDVVIFQFVKNPEIDLWEQMTDSLNYKLKESRSSWFKICIIAPR